MLVVRPSHALVVREDASISECVLLMRSRNVGSVLVQRAGDFPRLTGIFTERDLLAKVDDIRLGHHWDKPVLHLMSKPVKTLSLQELDRAPQFMLENRIRHVPIVYHDEQDRELLAGVISMRDVLASLWRRVEARAPEVISASERRIGILCGDLDHREVLIRLMRQGGTAQVVELRPEDIPSRVPQLDAVIVDLDHLAPHAWAPAVSALNKMTEVSSIFLLFDPLIQDIKVTELARKLSQAEKIAAYTKPISVLDLLNQLNLELGLKPSGRLGT